MSDFSAVMLQHLFFYLEIRDKRTDAASHSTNEILTLIVQYQ